MTETPSVPHEWLLEILSYLLGKPSTQEGTYGLPKEVAPVDHALRWWMFEGKTYQGLTGPAGTSVPLSRSWERLASDIARMRMWFSPRKRLVDHPVEPVDWGGTYARSGGAKPREYVAQSSAIGLTEAELAALCGWVNWICQEWESHAKSWKKPDSGFEQFRRETADLRRRGLSPMNDSLRHQWLRTVLRSRWPLLRLVVAESLKCFEGDERISRLPLPKTRDQLFELLCSVRLIRLFHPDPPRLQWLTSEFGTALQFQDGTFQLQCNWQREETILAAYQESGLPEAMRGFRIRVHRRPDLLIKFTPSRSSFAGMILEFKSGSQVPSSALHQLRSYRVMQNKTHPGRQVIWGVMETPEWNANISDPLQYLQHLMKGKDDDVWYFSDHSTESFKAGLMALGLLPPLSSTLEDGSVAGVAPEMVQLNSASPESNLSLSFSPSAG